MPNAVLHQVQQEDFADRVMLATAQPKPRPKLLDKRQKQAELNAQDRIERQKCKQRSGGQCEVWVVSSFAPMEGDRSSYFGVRVGSRRCPRRASQNHHLIGGQRRNKGKSILAEHRIDTCDRCHSEITNHVLVPVDGTLKDDAATVRYERIHK